ncbi:hypothetical protein [Burkholderia sp. 22PA0106]|uniref:hypothetical protein n=1 Tax=Burkholderia sp. 22PA0106 TaxID=3237371 RepID=UPI0039C09077
MQARPARAAPLIAVIGSDGAGKSTVCKHVLAWVSLYGPAAMVHLGKQSGNVGRSLGRLPVAGASLDRLLRRKIKKARTRIDAARQPDVLAALVIGVFVLRRWLRFRHMLALRRQGLIVVSDRFPQLKIPGAYDGPQFPSAQKGNPFVRWLARREHAAFTWMTSYRPDLVLRLNVDLDTACARKPDHSRATLKEKIAVTPLLSYHGAPIVDIDTTQPLAKVLEEAAAAVTKLMAEYGYSVSQASQPITGVRS